MWTSLPVSEMGMELSGFMQTHLESARSRRERAKRFFNGKLGEVIHYSKLSRFKPVEFEVYVVQPGLLKGQITEEQMNILSSAYEQSATLHNVR